MSPELLIAIAMFGALIFGIVVLGAHLGFVLAIVGVVFGLIFWGPGALSAITYRAFGIMTNYVIIAIPMFVFMGCILEKAGFAEDLYEGAEVVFGRLRGGLAVGTIVLSTGLAMCTGVVAASVGTAGVLALPAMLKRGYHKGLTLGTIAAGGTLGILIPPSIMIVMLASLAQISVGRLFLGAFLPGFLLAALYIAYILIIAAIRPQMAPRRVETAEERAKAGRHRLLRGIRGILPMGVIIFAVLGTIIFGIATPTEASGTGALVAILVAATYRRANWKNIRGAALHTVELMGMMGAVIIGAKAFSTVFVALGGAKMLSDLLVGIDASPMTVLVLIMLVIFILGMFIDWLAILLITLPVFLPIANTMGWDPIWFAMLLVVCLQTGWLTPPFGYALFFLVGIARRLAPEVTYSDIVLGCAPFVPLQLLGLGLVIAFPQIILFLPSLVFD